MQQLNFPDYQFSFTRIEGKIKVFDIIRKKYVSLTPEEWVRQHVLHFLVTEKKVPAGLLSVESEIRLFKTRKRFDIAVFDREGAALLVVECKSPAVPLTQDVVDQVVRYNMALQVRYLMITNGLEHFFFSSNEPGGRIQLIEDLPDYQHLI